MKSWSAIWKMSSEDFGDLVRRSDSYSEVLRGLGVRSAGGNFQTLKKRMVEEGVDCSHFGKLHGRRLTPSKRRLTPMEDVLVEESGYGRAHLKRRLFSEGLLENICSECGQGPEWRGMRLVLVLDHINGIHDDNRIFNLRVLCPNCNSQTNTFCGRQNKKKKKVLCCDCGVVISRKSKRCWPCYLVYASKCTERKNTRKVEWPTVEQLTKDLLEMSWLAVGRKYGVSDNAVRKWARKYGIL